MYHCPVASFPPPRFRLALTSNLLGDPWRRFQIVNLNVSTEQPTTGKVPFKIRLCAFCAYREAREGTDICRYCFEQQIARVWRDERIVDGHNPRKRSDV